MRKYFSDHLGFRAVGWFAIIWAVVFIPIFRFSGLDVPAYYIAILLLAGVAMLAISHASPPKGPRRWPFGPLSGKENTK